MTKIRGPTPLLISAITIAITGCDERDPRDPLFEDLVRREANSRESLAREREQLGEAARELVASDAATRRELTELQSHLQTEFESERREIDRQRDSLEEERRAIADRRHRDPLIANALVQVGTLLVASLPLVLLVLLARAARDEPDEAPLADLLIEDLSADRPRLLPPPPGDSPAALDDRRTDEVHDAG